MDKIEALEAIKTAWDDKNLSLAEKIDIISDKFYGSALDLSSTASFIHATPSELSALLDIGGLSEELIQEISNVDPPKTVWYFLASASEEEIKYAIDKLAADKKNGIKRNITDEDVYNALLELAGPTREQKLLNLSTDTLWYFAGKAKQFSDVLKPKEYAFLVSVCKRRKSGKTLTEKQLKWLVDILNRMIEKNVISTNSMDGDQERCDEVLKVMEE